MRAIIHKLAGIARVFYRQFVVCCSVLSPLFVGLLAVKSALCHGLLGRAVPSILIGYEYN